MYTEQKTLDEITKKLNNVEVILCDPTMTTIERVIYWGILKDSRDFGFSDRTNEEFADAFSCTRRTISRVVSRLKDKGYIRAEYDRGNYRTIYPLIQLPMTICELEEYPALIHERSILKREFAETHDSCIKKRIEKAEAQIKEIDDYIDSIPISSIRCAMSLHYRRRRSWQYIAGAMGGYRGADAYRKRCIRWMEEHSQSQ